MGNYRFFSIANSAASNYVMFSFNSSHSESAGTVANSNLGGNIFETSSIGAETAGSVACSGASSSGGGFACSGGSYSSVA